jgi:hypothetical protein
LGLGVGGLGGGARVAIGVRVALGVRAKVRVGISVRVRVGVRVRVRVGVRDGMGWDGMGGSRRVRPACRKSRTSGTKAQEGSNRLT